MEEKLHNARQLLQSILAASRELSRVLLHLFLLLRGDVLVLTVTYIVTNYLITQRINNMQKRCWNMLWGGFSERFVPDCGEEEAIGIVFLIPGFRYTKWELIQLAERLRQKGMIVFCAETEPEEGNIHARQELYEMNRAQFEQIAQLSQLYDLPISFAGSSTGGCHAGWCAREFMNQFSLNVDWIVAIQSPIRGSRLAKVGSELYGFAATDEMIIEKQPDGSWGTTPPVDELIACFQELEDRGVELMFFCALWDEVVKKNHGRLPDVPGRRAHHAHTLPHIGHWGSAGQNPWTVWEVSSFMQRMLRKEKRERAMTEPHPSTSAQAS